VTQVRIPPVLREAADGSKQVDLEGATVGEILARLVERFPALRDQLFTGEGELNRFVNVYLNSEDVRYLSELATPAGPRDTLVVLPAMAGGAASSKARLPTRIPAARGFANDRVIRSGPVDDENIAALPDTNDSSDRPDSRPPGGPHRPVQRLAERADALRPGASLRESLSFVA
jgi:sulfur-carrier protein